MPVTPIGKQGITPEVIAGHIQEDASQMREIYVVSIGKNGEIWQYHSGDVKGLAFASVILHDHALKASELC